MAPSKPDLCPVCGKPPFVQFQETSKGSLQLVPVSHLDCVQSVKRNLLMMQNAAKDINEQLTQAETEVARLREENDNYKVLHEKYRWTTMKELQAELERWKYIATHDESPMTGWCPRPSSIINHLARRYKEAHR